MLYNVNSAEKKLDFHTFEDAEKELFSYWYMHFCDGWATCSSIVLD